MLLGGEVFDYRATATAARNFIRDWQQKHSEKIELLADNLDGLRRMPCERLFFNW
ncbi:hypothetical protein [Nocardia sp. NPDC052112]|uniref:hypothetical protein n=1 Tax=Nocardia sp. NPDC052112 TaxID=3155646 RepID=UPI003421E6D6